MKITGMPESAFWERYLGARFFKTDFWYTNEIHSCKTRKFRKPESNNLDTTTLTCFNIAQPVRNTLVLRSLAFCKTFRNSTHSTNGMDRCVRYCARFACATSLSKKYKAAQTYLYSYHPKHTIALITT